MRLTDEERQIADEVAGRAARGDGATMKKSRRKPRDLSLGDCSEATLRSAYGEAASVGGRGWHADCNVPKLQFQAARPSHIARMRRLADWLMDAALWLEKEAERRQPETRKTNSREQRRRPT